MPRSPASGTEDQYAAARAPLAAALGSLAYCHVMSQARTSARARAGAGPGLVIARVGGIPIHVGSSWLLMAVLIVVVVGTGNPGLGGMGYAIGVVYAVGLLVAVLVHEGAHALTARAFGLQVHRIVADLWGGHTAYDGRGSTPGRSVVISLAGPLSNLALAGVAFLVELAFPSGLARTVVSGFVLVNLLLAAFNLLPGLPLDGGQIVDSLVWWATGSRERGLVAGGWSGRVVAGLVVVYFLGLPLARGQQPSITGLVWTMLIGGFMWQGASNAIRVGKARGVLAKVRLRDVLRPVVVVPTNTPIGSLAEAAEIPVGLDESGRPTLVTSQVEAGPDGAAGPGPHDPVSAIMVRVPEDCVVEATPDDDITTAVQAIQLTGVGIVVLTRGGAAYALTTGDAINQALAGVSPRAR